MDGLLLIDKPKGMTSYEAVLKVKEALGVKKAGHTGTLDPSATGLLLICVGKATKLTPFLQDLDKTYKGKMVFGITTSSLDEEGEIVEEKDASSLTREQVEEVFSHFTGKIRQTPPMFSAVHYRGERLYKLARKGVEVERPLRQVQVYELKLINFHAGRHPQAEFEVRCSKGTYIRSLCSDIGKALGCGAYQASLCRTKIGPFELKEAKKPSELERMDEIKIKEVLYSLSEALSHLPLVTVKKEAEKMVKWGRPLYLSHLQSFPFSIEKGDRVRLCSQEGKLLAVATSLQDGAHFLEERIGFKYLRVLV